MPNDTPDWATYQAFVSNNLFTGSLPVNTLKTIDTQQYASAIIDLHNSPIPGNLIVNHLDLQGNQIFQEFLGVPNFAGGVAWEIPLYGSSMSLYYKSSAGYVNLSVYGSSRQVANINQLFWPNSPSLFTYTASWSAGQEIQLQPSVPSDPQSTTYNNSVYVSGLFTGGAGYFAYSYTKSDGTAQVIPMMASSGGGIWQFATFIHPPVPLLWYFVAGPASAGATAFLAFSPSGT